MLPAIVEIIVETISAQLFVGGDEAIVIVGNSFCWNVPHLIIALIDTPPREIDNDTLPPNIEVFSIRVGFRVGICLNKIYFRDRVRFPSTIKGQQGQKIARAVSWVSGGKLTPFNHK